MSTIAEQSGPPIPEQYQRLVDDAAIFPPGNAPLPRAVTEHRTDRTRGYADLVGPFVVSDTRLVELTELLHDDPGSGSLEVSVVVTGGAGAIEPAVTWAARSEQLTLAGLEIALRGSSDDLSSNVARVCAAVDGLSRSGALDDEVPVYVEPPRYHPPEPPSPWLTALDEVAAMDLRLKFRTGGADEEAFPSPHELGQCIEAALDRELRFKCTAGLHHALRHRDEDTGFEHHGFLNVLLGTRAALDGATSEEVVTTLDEPDRAAVTKRLEAAGADGLRSARRWFTSFGSCSVLEPLEDLLDLHLLPNRPLDEA